MQKKAFDKIQHPSIIKTLQKMGIERTYLNVVKDIYVKPQEILLLMVKNWKCLFLRSGTRQGSPFSPLLFNIVLEVLVITIKEKKIHIEKKKK